MKAILPIILELAFFVGFSLQHTAILPPTGDRALKANSSDTPPGCRKLASDRGWPVDSIWRSSLPGVFKKLRGSEAPDWMFQAKSVADVQKAIKFAQDHNVRLTIISTGHDFIGR
jgi:hypothetical protein